MSQVTELEMPRALGKAETLLIFWEDENNQTQGCKGNMRPLKRALRRNFKKCPW